MKDRILVGIDVSSRSLAVSVEPSVGFVERSEIPNSSSGHQKLCRRITRHGGQARVCMESTGVYGLEAALALYQTPGIETMVANPRAVRDFAKACTQRSKTDMLDADILLEFARRMPFRPWEPPAQEALNLRAFARRIGTLNKTLTQDANRLHAVKFTPQLPDIVQNDIEVHRRFLRRRVKHLEKKAVDQIWASPSLRKALGHLTSVKGIAKASAIQILGELAILPRDMTARQWVAHAGLDPRSFQSGTSVCRPGRISRVGNRHLRAALFMPALVALQHEPHIHAFYDMLLDRGKKPKQAIVAVMRKLLHSIHGMLHHGVDFEGEKFYRIDEEKP